MTFQEFIDSNYRNAWIKEPGISIYVRNTVVTPYITTDFDLANMQAKKPGSGSLTNFLNKYEQCFTFRFENIYNDRLIIFLGKRGYSSNGYNPPCMRK